MHALKILKDFGTFTRTSVSSAVFAASFAAAGFLLLVIPAAMAKVIIDHARPVADLRLATVCAVISGISIGAFAILKILSDHLASLAVRNASSELSRKFFACTIANPNSDPAFPDGSRALELISTIPDEISIFLFRAIPAAVSRSAAFLALSIIVYMIDPALAIMILASLAIFILEGRLCKNLKTISILEEVKAQEALTRRICERVDAAESIRALSQAESEASAIATILKRRDRAGLKGGLIDALYSLADSPALKAWLFIVAWYIAYRMTSGAITVGAAIAAAVYALEAFSHVSSIKNLRLAHAAYAQGMKTAAAALASDEEAISGEGKISFCDLENSASFELCTSPLSGPGILAVVGASEETKRLVIGKLMTDIPQGGTAALVQDGEVAEVGPGKVGDRVGFLSQKALLFDGSIMENILYGSQQKERGDAIRAAQTVGADEFIDKLPGGYDSEAGPGGAYLCATERHLVAMARVLLRDPSMIIFHEPSSPADPASEYRMSEMMTAIARTKRIVLFASRLSSIRASDEIVFFEGAKIVERGKFESLFESGGAFRSYIAGNFGSAASFKHELQIEIERNSRYGSKFSLALIKISRLESYDQGVLEAAASAVASLIRVVDSSAQVKKEAIAILLPEIDRAHLLQFFSRMKESLPKKIAELTGGKTAVPGTISMAGTCISKKTNLSPDALIDVLMKPLSASGEKVLEKFVPEETLSMGDGN